MPSSFMNNMNDSNVMTLTGKAQVTTEPDIAILRLGVETTGDNLSEVQAENAALSQAVLQSLQQMGIEDITTYQYVITKVYEFVDGKRIDKGYLVRNIFEIRMDDMEMVGEVIDTAVKNGANTVEFIDFEVSDIDYYYLQALNLAVMNAYQKAKSIADHLGIEVDPVPRSIQENSVAPIPFRNYAAREGTFATPIEPGNKQIEASVTVEFIY